MHFKIVKKRLLSDIVFEQLRDNIYRGDLKAGQRLPPEKELADIMDVSKSTVRKAIYQLTSMGYIESLKGEGYFVKLPQAKDPHNPFAYIMTPGKSSLDELMEVRIGLESHGVILAAQRAEKNDILFLERSLPELTNKNSDREKARDADMKFHMGIAYATHNSVYIDLIRRFYDYMFHSISELHSLLYEKHNNLNIIEKQHLGIFDSIKDRNIEQASRCMIEHISFLRTFLQGDTGKARQPAGLR